MKNFLLFISVFILTMLICLFSNDVFGLTIDDYDLGNNQEVFNMLKQTEPREWTVIIDFDSSKYIVARMTSNNAYTEVAYNATTKTLHSQMYGSSILGCKMYYYYKNDWSLEYLGSNLEVPCNSLDNIILSNQPVYAYKTSTIIKNANFQNNVIFNYGDKITFKNTNTSPLNYTELLFKFSKYVSSIFYVTDENGEFVEQISFTLNNQVKYLIPPGATRNIYFSFLAQDYDTKVTYNYLNYLDVNHSVYYPTTKIFGGSTIKILGSSIPSNVPWIKSNSTTDIFYRYIEGSNTIIKKRRLKPNEKFTLVKGTDYLFKFLHEPTTIISLQSNFVMNDTSERISLLSDESLSEQIIKNGGSIIDDNSADHYYEVNRTKDIVVTSLKDTSLLGGRIIEVYVTPSSTSKIYTSSYLEYNDKGLYKDKEFFIDGKLNQNTYRTALNPQGFLVFEEQGTGSFSLRIDGKYKENEDFKIEFVNQYEYDDLIESEYDSIEPNTPNIDDVLDNGTKVVDKNLWDSIFKGNAWSGVNSDNQLNDSDYTLELGTVKNTLGSVTGIVDIFIQPIQKVFTGIPELYGLIILGFGLGLVMFILGR